jgi:hypothetical protein
VHGDYQSALDDFERRFGAATHEEVAYRHPSSTRDRTPPSGETAAKPTVVARVNGGRWIVDCPFCHGAERANFTTGLFFCCECRNGPVGNAFLKVAIPKEAERAAIAEALLVRPDWRTRNWRPHETIRDLHAENRAHGVAG